jgi:hypothetical protein
MNRFPLNKMIGFAAADLVFSPTLAGRSYRSTVSRPHYTLSQGLKPWPGLPLDRTMLAGALAGLRGSFRLRLASTCNHRPATKPSIDYNTFWEKTQGIFVIFGGNLQKIPFGAIFSRLTPVLRCSPLREGWILPCRMRYGQTITGALSFHKP